MAPAYPLKVSSNRRYLVDQSGVPFQMVGDAAWSLIAQLTIENVAVYLDDRQAKGFNTIIVNLIEHHFCTNPPANVYGDQPFTVTGDFSTPNETYFTRADAVIQAAAARGIQVLFFPCYLGAGGNAEGWYQELVANGATKASNWGIYVGNRYKNFDNIIWMMGGDYTPSASGQTLVDAIANGIKSVDSRHIFGSHGASFQPYPRASWTDIDAIYNYGEVPASVAGQYNLADFKPVFFMESGYEGESGTSLDIRQHAYEGLLLGGCCGQFFGNNPVWLFDPGWQAALGSSGATHIRHCGQFFKPKAWYKLSPDGGTLLTAGVGSDPTRACAAIASDKTLGIIYVPTTRSMTIARGAFPRSIDAKWVDPTNGAAQNVSGAPWPNSGSIVVSATPGANALGETDWILWLDASTRPPTRQAIATSAGFF